MDLTIGDFWKPRLEVTERAAGEVVRGWNHVSEGLPTFLEAPLRLAPGLEGSDPLEASVILVSAPGAVGKSTLARQIAFETNSMLVDLAEAEPVGGNTVVGGLAKTGLYTPFLQGQASLIIDGLDEARMIAPQRHFEAFLNDVKGLADTSRKPLVLLGRTGAVQESWMILDDLGITAAVLEIQHYDDDQAAEFAKIRVQDLRKEARRRSPDGEAIGLLLDRFRKQTGEEGGVFAGYSPVLIAIAESIADRDAAPAQNTQRLIAQIRRGEAPITLSDITRSILEREQGKLKGGDLEDSSLIGELYGPEEQLARLAAVLYPGLPIPPLPPMSDKDLETYNGRLETWLHEHPFLHANGREASSAVFGGVIASHALLNPANANDSLSTRILGEKVNPFLARFYLAGLRACSGQEITIPSSHVGVLYASVRAGLTMGETASLRIEGETGGEEGSDDTAEVEITRMRGDRGEWEPLRFITDANGNFHLGSRIENIDMAVPGAEVTLGPGSEAVLVAPVSIDASAIYIDADRIVAEISGRRADEIGADHAMVWLGSEHVVVPGPLSRPVRRAGAVLGLSGPWAENYPWRDFRVVRKENSDPRIASAERALFRILRLCRSRQPGVMGAPRAAIDDLRRSRGTGRVVRNQLLREQVLTVREHLYELHLGLLASRVGLTFQLIRSRTSKSETVAFLQRALARADGDPLSGAN